MYKYIFNALVTNNNMSSFHDKNKLPRIDNVVYNREKYDFENKVIEINKIVKKIDKYIKDKSVLYISSSEKIQECYLIIQDEIKKIIDILFNSEFPAVISLEIEKKKPDNITIIYIQIIYHIAKIINKYYIKEDDLIFNLLTIYHNEKKKKQLSEKFLITDTIHRLKYELSINFEILKEQILNIIKKYYFNVKLIDQYYTIENKDQKDIIKY